MLKKLIKKLQTIDDKNDSSKHQNKLIKSFRLKVIKFYETSVDYLQRGYIKIEELELLNDNFPNAQNLIYKLKKEHTQNEYLKAFNEVLKAERILPDIQLKQAQEEAHYLHEHLERAKAVVANSPVEIKAKEDQVLIINNKITNNDTLIQSLITVKATIEPKKKRGRPTKAAAAKEKERNQAQLVEIKLKEELEEKL